MDIKKIPTDELVRELIGREGIKLIPIGVYRNYELRAKYGVEPIEANSVIVLPLDMTLNV